MRLGTLDRRLLQLRRLPDAATASGAATAAAAHAAAAGASRTAAAVRATAATAAARGATGRVPRHVCACERLALRRRRAGQHVRHVHPRLRLCRLWAPRAAAVAADAADVATAARAAALAPTAAHATALAAAALAALAASTLVASTLAAAADVAAAAAAHTEHLLPHPRLHRRRPAGLELRWDGRRLRATLPLTLLPRGPLCVGRCSVRSWSRVSARLASAAAVPGITAVPMRAAGTPAHPTARLAAHPPATFPARLTQRATAGRVRRLMHLYVEGPACGARRLLRRWRGGGGPRRLPAGHRLHRLRRSRLPSPCTAPLAAAWAAAAAATQTATPSLAPFSAGLAAASAVAV